MKENLKSEEIRFKDTKRAGIIGIFGNIFLLLIKAFIGFMFKSQSMIADSFNSAADIFASLMTFIGNKIASKPQDADHNLGHGKAEYIFSLFIGISMIIISAKLLYDSTLSLFAGNAIIFSWFLVLASGITIITKLILYFYTKKLAKKYKNILLEANMLDHRNDCIISSFTLISSLLSLKGINFFDSIVGIGISIWICYTGIKIFIESYNILMDISIDDNTKKLILEISHNYPDIKKIEDITSSPVGYKYLVSLTIFVAGNMTTLESHKLADEFEKAISNLDKIYKVIVHVHPI